VTNLADTGKKKVQQVTVAIEDFFVHPLLRGKDTGRWSAESQLSIVLPQDPQARAKAMDVGRLKRAHPLTYSFFRTFEADIRGCALLKQFFDPAQDPFYSSYNVGDYTYAPYKVVWKEICQEIEAAVVVSESIPIIPDHKLVLVAFDSPEPAYFLAGFLNSSPLRLFVRVYSVQTSVSGIFDYVRIPAVADAGDVFQTVAKLGKEAHDATKKGDESQVRSIEARIDQAVASFWGITPEELDNIHKVLASM